MIESETLIQIYSVFIELCALMINFNLNSSETKVLEQQLGNKGMVAVSKYDYEIG